ncbi:hypothetical protein ACLKA6_010126 [Drosophila palustris]
MVLPRVAAMFSDLVCAMPVALSYLESELGCVEDDIPRFRIADQVQHKQEKDDKPDQKMEQETIEEKDSVRQTENDADHGGHQGDAETKKTVA